MLTLEPWHDESCRLEIPAGAGSKPRSFTLFTLLKMLAEYEGSSAKHSANEACIRRLLGASNELSLAGPGDAIPADVR